MISDKDTLIGEKEKKIYELKKRNQELEKFKFVLDYKIKELKRQIEPRENEIADMRRQIKEVDAELEAYHRSNAELDLLIGSLRQQLDDMQRSVLQYRSRLQKQEATVKSFEHDLYHVAQELQRPDDLVDGVRHLVSEHVPKKLTAATGNKAIAQEYRRQRDHLQRSIAALRKEMVDSNAANKTANMTIMQENMTLISEVKELRTMLISLKQQQAANKVKAARAAAAGGAGAGTGRRPPSARPALEDVGATVERQRAEVGALKGEIRRLEGLLAGRAASTERPDAL